MEQPGEIVLVVQDYLEGEPHVQIIRQQPFDHTEELQQQELQHQELQQHEVQQTHELQQQEELQHQQELQLQQEQNQQDLQQEELQLQQQELQGQQQLEMQQQEFHQQDIQYEELQSQPEPKYEQELIDQKHEVKIEADGDDADIEDISLFNDEKGKDDSDTGEKYYCSACSEVSNTIFDLHVHMREHGSGGSYFFDHVTCTAFPRYDTFCSFTQTSGGVERALPDGIEVQVNEEYDRDSDSDDIDSDLSEMLREEQEFEEYDSESEQTDRPRLQGKGPPQTNKRKRSNAKAELSDEEYVPEGQQRTEKKRLRVIDIKPDGTEYVKLEPIEMEEATVKKSSVRFSTKRRVIKKKVFDDCLDDKENDDVLQELEDHDSKLMMENDEDLQEIAEALNHDQEIGENGDVKPTKKISVKIQPKQKKYIKKEKKENPLNQCGICDNFIPKEEWETHIMMEHPSPRPYICETCGHSFTTKRFLKRHMMTHKVTKPWKCDTCDKSFIQRAERDVHVRRRHTGERPFTCKVCEKTFYCSKTLSNHEANVHMGVTRFECEICGRRFFKKSGLEIHMATHYEATMKCSYCDRKFRDKTGLKRHENTHTGKKNYHCHICDKGFIQSTPFWDHMERKHGMDRNKLKDKLAEIRWANKRSGKKTQVNELPVDVDLESLMIPGGDINAYKQRTTPAPKKKKVIKIPNPITQKPQQIHIPVSQVTEHKIVDPGQSVIHLDNLSLDLPQLINSQGGLADKTIIIIEKDYLDLANSQSYQDAIAYATEEIKPPEGSTVLIAGSTDVGGEDATVQNIEIPVNFGGDSNEVTVVTLPPSDVPVDMQNQDQATQCEVHNY